ncbi:MAG: hypothetical protein ACOC9Z_00855 [Chloroflexota bacterium]
MDLQAVTGQLYTIDGKIQETPRVPGLLAQAPPAKASRGRARDSLFIHLSLTGSAQEYGNLAQDLLDRISDRYYATPGSVTATLRKAILQANQLLLNYNLSKTGATREGAITCAVLRGNELYVVQAGEALALIARNFGLERMPPQDQQPETPLGRTAGLDLRYYHNWLETGDMLLLADPRVVHLRAEQLKPALVDSTVEDSIPYLTRLLEGETARLLLVEFSDETPIGIPETVAPVARPERRSQSGPSTELAPPARRPLRASDVPEQTTGASKRRTPTLPDVPLPTAEDLEYSARQATSRTALGLSRVVEWVARFMQRLRPSAGDDAQEDEEPGGWALAAIVAILVPVIVGLVIGGVYIQRGRVARVAEIRTEMQQALALAEEQETEAQAREHYLQALNLAAEAELLRPGDGTVTQLRAQALEALDRVDDVTRLTAEVLYEYDEASNMVAASLRDGLNGDFYTLDGANNRVFAHETEEDYLTSENLNPEEVLFGGQAIGTHIVGQMIDMSWRAGGTQVANEGIAVLDGRGALLTFHPGFSNVRAVPLGLASEWDTPVAIAQFNERFYVLDRGAGVIWRYFAEGDGFIVDDAQRSLTLPDLGQAVDFAIYSEDGSVIVLYEDGRIRRYGQDSLLWDESQLAANGLGTPLVSPRYLKIVGSGLNSSLFIADPGSGRIVQTSLGGTFLAQYKVLDPERGDELLTRMGDFDVADNPLRIFVPAENKLFVATQD